jgi:hypothetical protein
MTAVGSETWWQWLQPIGDNACKGAVRKRKGVRRERIAER